MRNATWNKQWKGYIAGLNGLVIIPNDKDSQRVEDIMKELKDIVDKNTVKVEASASVKGVEE